MISTAIPTNAEISAHCTVGRREGANVMAEQLQTKDNCWSMNENKKESAVRETGADATPVTHSRHLCLILLLSCLHDL